jgi:hypothetical protein
MIGIPGARMSEVALPPFEQNTVFFHDEITAALLDVNGRQVVCVSIKAGQRG